MAFSSSPQPASPQWVLNLCDVVGTTSAAVTALPQALEVLAQQALNDTGVSHFDRIYVGSYFCDRLFTSLSTSFFEAARGLAASLGTPLTLVAPIFGQRTLTGGLERIKKLMGPGGDFDELVVNDEALAQHMASWLATAYPEASLRPRLGRGRLLAKAWRDPRYGAPATQPIPLDGRQASVEISQWRPSFMELDPFAPVIDASGLDQALPIALHLPHAALTTGHICKAASIGLEASRSFRAGAPCKRQCLGGVDVFQSLGLGPAEGSPVFLTQQGRTVFFENPDCRIVGDSAARIVWSPADFGCPTWEGRELLWE